MIANSRLDVLRSRLTNLQLTLTALNLSRTAYASFALDARAFFIHYKFDSQSKTSGGDRFTCQLFNKVSSHHAKDRAREILTMTRHFNRFLKAGRLTFVDERLPWRGAT